MNSTAHDPASLRLLFLVDSLRVGGKERQICELLKAILSDVSVEAMVVTMDREQFYVPEVRKLGVPLIYLLRRSRWDPTVFLRLNRILREFRPHIVHSNSEMAISYAWPLARLTGIKLINGTIRNAFSGHGLRWQWHKLMLRLADARVSNSQAGFFSRGLRPDSPGNYVIYNGLDMERFNACTEDQSMDALLEAANQKIVGMVAEFSDYKDFRTFIQAAQLVLTRRDDVVFVAVGAGKNLEACMAMVPPTERRIHFLGQRDKVERLVQQMDIGVLCTFTEGISNSVMEYMAAGKPVIVTEGGGSDELVVNGKEGFLVPGQTPTAVAEKIELLLDDPERVRQMGNLGRLRVTKRFSLEALAEKSLRMYQDLRNTP